MYGRRKARPPEFSNGKPFIGLHYIVDIDNVRKDLISNNDKLIQLCDMSLERGEATILNKMIHHFEPHGLTLLYLLSESHFSMHTWPEYNRIRIDFFTCDNNEHKCNRVITHLKNEFLGSNFNSKMLKR